MSAAKDSCEDFCYSFIESSFIDHDRAKTLSAMITLWERVPQDDMDTKRLEFSSSHPRLRRWARRGYSWERPTGTTDGFISLPRWKAKARLTLIQLWRMSSRILCSAIATAVLPLEP